MGLDSATASFWRMGSLLGQSPLLFEQSLHSRKVFTGNSELVHVHHPHRRHLAARVPNQDFGVESGERATGFAPAVSCAVKKASLACAPKHCRGLARCALHLGDVLPTGGVKCVCLHRVFGDRLGIPEPTEGVEEDRAPEKENHDVAAGDLYGNPGPLTFG